MNIKKGKKFIAVALHGNSIAVRIVIIKNKRFR